MHSRFYQVMGVKPEIVTIGGDPFTTTWALDDLLFDWVSFEIPKGAAKLVNASATIIGINSGTGNNVDMDLYFARSLDGVAPPSLGSCNAAISKANAVLSRRHLIQAARWDAATLNTKGAALGGGNYYVFGGSLDTAGENLDIPHYPILQGEGSEAVGGTPGFQTIYLAAAAQGAFDFGTGMAVDNGAGYTAGETGTLNFDGTAGDILFAPGEEIMAEDGAVIGEIESISDDGSHTSVVIKGGLVADIEDNDEVGLRHPIVFNFGFEY